MRLWIRLIHRVNFGSINSPLLAGPFTITWDAGDQLAGISHYALAMKVNNGEWQTLDSNLSKEASSYIINVNETELIIIRLMVMDNAGNVTIGKTALYSEGYVFPEGLIFPIFFNNH